MATINVDQIMAAEPCERWPRERVERAVGGGIEPADVPSAPHGARSCALPVRDLYGCSIHTIYRRAAEKIFQKTGKYC